MNYSDQNDRVRVDFFKESGKWYVTEAVTFGPYDGKVLIYDAFSKSLAAHLWDSRIKRFRFEDMWAVCLVPYHEHTHPLMMRVRDEDLRRWLPEGTT